MRKMKRTISMILCLAMLFVAMPIPSLAEGEEAPAPAEVQAPEEDQEQAGPKATTQPTPQAIEQTDLQGIEQAGSQAAERIELQATDPVDANRQAGEENPTDPNGNGVPAVKSNKTATRLNSRNETEITLTFPGKQDKLASDVVFVLDKSGASAQADIYNQAKTFLAEVKTKAKEKGIPVKVGVVLFNASAISSKSSRNSQRDTTTF